MLYTSSFHNIKLLSTYLLHLLQSFLLLCWDEALLLSLEAIAAAQWKSKCLWILCHNWHGRLFLFGYKDSAMKFNCASWVGTWKHKRNAFVWGTELGLNSLSVFVLVSTTHRQLLPTVKWHYIFCHWVYSGLMLHTVPFHEFFSPLTLTAFSPNSPPTLFLA
jgi:hypothetical protein